MKRYIKSNTAFNTQRNYIIECLQDAPEVPTDDPSDNPEAWSEYFRDDKEYKIWCFVDAVDEGIFREHEEEKFYRMWDSLSTELAQPYA